MFAHCSTSRYMVGQSFLGLPSNARMCRHHAVLVSPHIHEPARNHSSAPTHRATLTFECGTASIALDIHLKDGGVMNKAVDSCQRHSLVWEDLTPFAERLVGGDQHRAPLVSASDQLEQHTRFGLIP